MRFDFIRAEKAHYPVKMLCSVLGVSRSGYYAWERRGPSSRELEDRELLQEIRRVHVRHRGRYGSPRVWRELRRSGHRIGCKRVERLMRENGIVARPRRRFRVTTESDHGLARCRNLLARAFDVERVNDVWAADLTYLDTIEGWLYLAVILDLASRRVIGWSMSDSMESSIAIDALEMALDGREPPRMHHSDQGVQYASARYQALLSEHHITPSMSRRGDCWDNAPVESFFATLKAECPELDYRPTKQQARSTVFEYIEAYYNRQRLHSTLDYLTPIEYEEQPR